MRLLRIGEAVDEVAYNLTMTANAVQDHFEFVADDRVLPLPESLSGQSSVSGEALRDFVAAEAKSRFPDEYPIAITDVPLQRDYSALFDTEAAVVTTHAKAAAAPNFSLQRYLIFQVVDVLMTRHVDLPFHSKVIGCISDYIDELPEMERGIANCEYCTACRRRITQAFAEGRLSLARVAAIYRLLDFAAERHRCFVLMPFAETFDETYKSVSRTLRGLGWQCMRADQIFRAHDVMSTVWEEIMRADLIVADLTGQNANVFYELGFAHALNKQTILLTQTIADVPFDLRQRRLVEYASDKAGQRVLRRAIQLHLR